MCGVGNRALASRYNPTSGDLFDVAVHPSFYLLEVIAPDRGGEQRVPQNNTNYKMLVHRTTHEAFSDSLHSVISDRKNNASDPAERQMRPSKHRPPRDKARNQANQAGPTERTKRS